MLVPGVKLPDTHNASVDMNTSITVEECKLRCLASCCCVAFAAADIRGNGSGCIIWTDNLIDLRYVDGGQLLYLRLPKSELGMRTSTITLYILVHLHRDAILLSFQDFNIEVYSTLPLSQIFVCFDIGCRTRGTLTRAIGNRKTLVASYYCSGIRHGFYSRTGLTICYRGVGLVEHMGHYMFDLGTPTTYSKPFLSICSNQIYANRSANYSKLSDETCILSTWSCSST